MLLEADGVEQIFTVILPSALRERVAKCGRSLLPVM